MNLPPMMHRYFILFLCSLLFFSSTTALAQSYGQRVGQQKGEMNKTGGLESFGTKAPKGISDSGSANNSSGGSGVFNEISYQLHILGAVKNPGTYRLPASTRLEEAVARAGGVSDRGSKRKIELRQGEKTFYFDLFKFEKFGDLNQNPFLRDNDVIFIPYSQRNVAIQGPIKSTGIYELVGSEDSVWNLLELAGGFTVGVLRTEPLTVIRYIDGEKQLLKVPNTEEDLKQFQLLNGDVVIVPHIFVKNRRFDYNLPELPADNQFYPTQKSDVYITGAVAQPGAFAFVPNFSIRDFVNTAGITEMSNPRGVYVLTADGEYVKNPEKKKDFHLSPGDTLFVPKRVWTTDNVLRWYNTVTGTVFSVFAFKQLLRGQW